MSNVTDFTERWVKRQEEHEALTPVPEYETDSRFLIMQPYQVVTMLQELAWERFYNLDDLKAVQVEQLMTVLLSVLDKIHFHADLKASVFVREHKDDGYNVIVYAIDLERAHAAKQEGTKPKANFILEAKFITFESPLEPWSELVVSVGQLLFDIPDDKITTRQAARMVTNMNALVNANSGCGKLHNNGQHYAVFIPAGGQQAIMVTLGFENPMALDEYRHG